VASIVTSIALLIVSIWPIVWHRYFEKAQYEDVGKEFGLRRTRWEPLKNWEARIWAAQKELLDASEELTREAERIGTWRFFPPRQRPSMPDSVIWTTGIDLSTMTPIIWWLNNDHPAAVRYRSARKVGS
jgi:hypothetical protein